jgi:hypothetical protein
MGATLNCTNVKTGNYWYLSRTTSFGHRFFPAKVTLTHGINTVVWTRNFNDAMTFPSEHSVQYFVKQRHWYQDKVEIVHISRGSMRSMIRVQ